MIRRADSISDAAVKRGAPVRIGDVEGSLISVHTCRGITHLEMRVGGLTSLWFLLPETEVEVA